MNIRDKLYGNQRALDRFDAIGGILIVVLILASAIWSGK